MQGFVQIKKKAITVEEMRKVDARAVSLGIPVYLMMENAGNALAKQLLLGLRRNVRGKKVAIVCGLSNNGGAGFSSARHLSYYGANVSVILLGRPAHIRTKDAKLQWTTIEKINVISKITVEGKNDLRRMKMTIADSDGAEHIIGNLANFFISLGFTIPAASTLTVLWSGQSKGSNKSREELWKYYEKTYTSMAKGAAQNLAFMANLLEQNPLPDSLRP